MRAGTTPSGFCWEVDEAALDDMELLEDLVALDRGSAGALSSALVRLLGAEQKKRLYEHHRGENGRVSKAGVISDMREIFAALRTGKKS